MILPILIRLEELLDEQPLPRYKQQEYNILIYSLKESGHKTLYESYHRRIYGEVPK